MKPEQKSSSNKEPKKNLPATVDFSSVAIKKAVNEEITQHPVTVFSGLATTSCILYMVLFGASSSLFGLSLLCFSLASGSFIFNKFFRQEVFEMKHVAKLREALHRQTELTIIKLKKELKTFDCPEGVRQIDELKEKYESLVSVLSKKLKPGGLAYGRFLGMAEQVYKNGLDNLQQVVACLDSISVIDPNHIQEQQKSLHDRLATDNSVKTEIEALQNTLKMREERMAEVAKRLRENVLAMNRLDQTAMDISTMETEEERATTAMEDAMNELVYLAKTFRDFKTK